MLVMACQIQIQSQCDLKSACKPDVNCVVFQWIVWDMNYDNTVQQLKEVSNFEDILVLYMICWILR